MKNVWILCEGIWSLGKNAGVTSLGRLILALNKKSNVTLFSPFKEEMDCYKRVCIPTISFDFKNRYLAYAVSIFKWIWINLFFIYYGLGCREKPDIIYVSSNLPILAGYVLSKWYGIPYIQRQYGTFLRDKLNSKVEKLKNFREVLSYKLPAKLFIITDDGTFGDEVAAYFGIPFTRVLFLKNGIDKVTFDDKNNIRQSIRDKHGFNDNDVIVVSVSRLVGWKRVDRTIKAFNKIDSNNIKLIIIGDGSERENLEKLSKNDNIFFLGAISNSAVKKYLLACDIFVSMYDLSNVGNPLLEALSAGIAVITLDNGNTASVYTGDNFVMLPSQDEKQIIDNLYNKLLELKDNPEKRKKLGENARSYADKDLMSWDERINKEKDAILSMIEK